MSFHPTLDSLLRGDLQMFLAIILVTKLGADAMGVRQFGGQFVDDPRLRARVELAAPQPFRFAPLDLLQRRAAGNIFDRRRNASLNPIRS